MRSRPRQRRRPRGCAISDGDHSQADGRFVIWAGLCDAGTAPPSAEAVWLELGTREELAMALYELGHPSPHYLGVRVTHRDAQRPVYEKLVPDMAARVAMMRGVKLPATRSEPSEN